MHIIRSRGTLSCYEVCKFINDGFLYCNRHSGRSSRTKPQSIAIARFTNNHGQLLSLDLLESLFRSKHRKYRSTLSYIQSMARDEDYR